MTDALETVIADIRARRQALDEEERQLAAAAESMTLNDRVQLERMLTTREERQRVLMLIDQQLEYFKRGCNTYTVLKTLKKQVAEE